VPVDEARKEGEKLEEWIIVFLDQIISYFKRLKGLAREMKSLSFDERVAAEISYEAWQGYFKAVLQGLNELLPLKQREKKFES